MRGEDYYSSSVSLGLENYVISAGGNVRVHGYLYGNNGDEGTRGQTLDFFKVK